MVSVRASCDTERGVACDECGSLHVMIWWTLSLIRFGFNLSTDK